MPAWGCCGAVWLGANVGAHAPTSLTGASISTPTTHGGSYLRRRYVGRGGGSEWRVNAPRPHRGNADRFRRAGRSARYQQVHPPVCEERPLTPPSTPIWPRPRVLASRAPRRSSSTAIRSSAPSPPKTSSAPSRLRPRSRDQRRNRRRVVRAMLRTQRCNQRHAEAVRMVGGPTQHRGVLSIEA